MKKPPPSGRAGRSRCGSSSSKYLKNPVGCGDFADDMGSGRRGFERSRIQRIRTEARQRPAERRRHGLGAVRFFAAGRQYESRRVRGSEGQDQRERRDPEFVLGEAAEELDRDQEQPRAGSAQRPDRRDQRLPRRGEAIRRRNACIPASARAFPTMGHIHIEVTAVGREPLVVE